VFRLKLLDDAHDDLENILRYITLQSGSEETGTAFVLRLLDKCASLAAAEFKLGRLRPELGPELRSLPFGNYILFFRYSEGWLEIVNILEGHRDMDDYFTSEPSDT
jgi:toxin ParE1/3/4